MNGWIKIHRQMLDWEWYQNNNVKVLFIHLLLLANHSEGKWQGFIIKRGQVLTSNGHLAERLGLSIQQVRTALKKLEKTKEITIKSTNRNKIITIENYEKFQDEIIDINNQINNQITNKQQSNNNQITTIKKEKNKKNNEKEENTLLLYEKFKKPSIEEIKDYISIKNYDVDAEWFYNYYEANGWKVGRNKMKSWKACLNTWNQKAKKDKEKNRPNYNNYSQRTYHDLDSLYTNITKGF